MGKIVKYCTVCEESFSEKFSFCPNCAGSLIAYEINPIAAETKKAEFATEFSGKDEIYQITFVENRSGKTRKTLLLGAFLFVTGGFILALVASIYNADAYVAALDDNLTNIVYVNPDEVAKVEPEPVSEKDKKSGEGGNGGNHNPNPISKGQYANESENPQIAPSITSYRLKNPEIPIEMQTKGVTKRKIKDEPYGVTTSQYNVESDGPGENGGQGNGRDRGQGTKDGPGSGITFGPGGNGPGGTEGPGKKQKEPKEEEPPPPKAVTIALKILSKPRAIYTDAARRNQIAGTVTLRVTFNANGTIGNIVAISGLPDGLTEQAIVAARNIQFEPAKRNGVAQTVTKQVQYTFTLY